MAEADVVLALIGSRWLTVTGADGQRRLDDPDDYVAMELRLALESGLPVIPVLVQGARMPPADQLPEAIRALTGDGYLEGEASLFRWLLRALATRHPTG